LKRSTLSELTRFIEPFLRSWSEGMDEAGYLKYTTAKREDCIQSFWYFLSPLLDHLDEGGAIPPFGHLIENRGKWAEPLLDVAKRHGLRGISPEMFYGCFKTFLHALERVVYEMDLPPPDKLDTIGHIRRWSDAFETILVGKFDLTTSQHQTLARLAEINRLLTLEKNKYENIFSATSDMVFITDSEGAVLEANSTARRWLGNREPLGEFFWKTLDLEGRNMAEVIQYYEPNRFHELKPFDDISIFRMTIIPLQTVSLATKGYMVVVSDVSCLVQQRESLEKTVTERSLALENREKQYSSLFQAAGESILLIDTDLRILQANERTGQVFGLSPERVCGMDCNALCKPGQEMDLKHAIRNLDEREVWKGEMEGLRSDGKAFTMAVTVNRVDLDARTVFLVLVRDVTREKRLEERLSQEKSYMEEVNITLRTVLRTIDKERQDVQDQISQRIKKVLLPSLDKIRDTNARPVHKAYFDVLRDELINLSNGFGTEDDARLLKLTPTEMKICQFIQAGSTNKDIADSLGLSVETVQTHRKNIRGKLGLRGKDINLYTFLNAGKRMSLAVGAQ
jgi:PAS domain S-box-containing protein